ncbi:MAG: UPF0280 family protein [Spirochaetales bacterium]|nr:UPF0280 family protein [Spirochaetales bacterium]
MVRLKRFSLKNCHYNISAFYFCIISSEILRLRKELEKYILLQPEFSTALAPIDLLPEAPPIAVRMADAARKTGVGPMAAVAGSFAQAASEKALEQGAAEVIVENGGDIFLCASKEIVIGLYTGQDSPFKGLAFRLLPSYMPTSVCSSSGRMGHSLSHGNCDLATVLSPDAALADAAATLAGNLVKNEKDITPVLERISSIDGIRGVLIIKGDKMGMMGNLPELIRSSHSDIHTKVTHDPSWVIY